MNWASLEAVAWIWLLAAASSALLIALDITAGHRQHMWIMNLVWPLTALYSGPLGLIAYYRFGRLSSHAAVAQARERGETPPGKRKPFLQVAAIGTTHCGSGCTLGDIVAEWFVFFVPLSLFGRPIYATWVPDYSVAFAFGMRSNTSPSSPMKKLSQGAGPQNSRY